MGQGCLLPNNADLLKGCIRSCRGLPFHLADPAVYVGIDILEASAPGYFRAARDDANRFSSNEYLYVFIHVDLLKGPLYAAKSLVTLPIVVRKLPTQDFDLCPKFVYLGP